MRLRSIRHALAETENRTLISSYPETEAIILTQIGPAVLRVRNIFKARS